MRSSGQGIARSATTAVRFAREETRASASAFRAHLRAILARDSAPSTNNESDIPASKKRLAKGIKGGSPFARPWKRKQIFSCTHAAREDRMNMGIQDVRKSPNMSHRLGGPRFVIGGQVVRRGRTFHVFRGRVERQNAIAPRRLSFAAPSILGRFFLIHLARKPGASSLIKEVWRSHETANLCDRKGHTIETGFAERREHPPLRRIEGD